MRSLIAIGGLKIDPLEVIGSRFSPHEENEPVEILTRAGSFLFFSNEPGYGEALAYHETARTVLTLGPVHGARERPAATERARLSPSELDEAS